MRAWLLVLLFMSGCAAPVDKTPAYSTDDQSEADARSETVAPGFPQLVVAQVAYDNPDDDNEDDEDLDEDEPVYFLLRHDSGPCIAPPDYQWTTTEGRHENIVEPMARNEQGLVTEPLASWCIREIGAIPYGETWEEIRLRAYDKSSGVLMIDMQLQPENLTERASWTITSPSSGILEVTLVREGQNAPYSNTDGSGSNDWSISIRGTACMNDDFQAPVATWKAGAVIRISAGRSASGCSGEFAAGQQDVPVTVSAGNRSITHAVDVRA